MVVSGFATALLLLGFWFFVVYGAWQRINVNQQSSTLYKALALWPLCLVDTVVRLSGLNDWFAVSGLFHFIPVLIFAYVLHFWCRSLQPQAPASVLATVATVGTVLVLQIPLILQPIDFGQWISASPLNQIGVYWPVYLTYLGGSVAGITLVMRLVEISHRYNTYLSWQAVDIKRYQFQNLTTLVAFASMILIAQLILLFAIALGFYALVDWPVVVDLASAAVAILLLAQCVFTQHFITSPLNYNKLFSVAGKSTLNIDNIILQAEKTMVSSKAYKEIGYTIEAFCKQADLDPTDLALALKQKNSQDFRGFVFHYRMAYAKNIVMRSDASIAAVAKRLGFHSEKFLSGPFLSYLERRK